MLERRDGELVRCNPSVDDQLKRLLNDTDMVDVLGLSFDLQVDEPGPVRDKFEQLLEQGNRQMPQCFSVFFRYKSIGNG